MGVAREQSQKGMRGFKLGFEYAICNKVCDKQYFKDAIKQLERSDVPKSVLGQHRLRYIRWVSFRWVVRDIVLQ